MESTKEFILQGSALLIGMFALLVLAVILWAFAVQWTRRQIEKGLCTNCGKKLEGDLPDVKPDN